MSERDIDELPGWLKELWETRPSIARQAEKTFDDLESANAIEVAKWQELYFELWNRYENRNPVALFESAILRFGTKAALEYFATPKELHNLFNDEWKAAVIASEALSKGE